MITKAFEKELAALLVEHSIGILAGLPPALLAKNITEYIDSLQKMNRLAGFKREVEAEVAENAAQTPDSSSRV